MELYPLHKLRTLVFFPKIGEKIHWIWSKELTTSISHYNQLYYTYMCLYVCSHKWCTKTNYQIRLEKGCASNNFRNGLYYQLDTRICEQHPEIINIWNSLSCVYTFDFAFVRESMLWMSNQIISSKILNFHAVEVKATILWDEKNVLPLTLKSKRKKIIKSSKGLITEAVSGKSVFLMLSIWEDVWIKKKNPTSFSLAFQS